MRIFFSFFLYFFYIFTYLFVILIYLLYLYVLIITLLCVSREAFLHFFIFIFMVGLSSFIGRFSSFGFSGSRSCPVACGLALGVLGSVPLHSHIITGCATGVDAVIRAACLARPVPPRVFEAASGQGGALAFRSASCVRYVRSVSGLWCAFPSRPCPCYVMPSASFSDCFCGGGSGTWASLAFAIGIGCAVMVVLPPDILPPAWFYGRLAYASGVWYCYARPIYSLF